MSPSKYLLALFFAGLITTLQAQEAKLPDLDLGKSGTVYHVQGNVEPEAIGRFDKLVLLPAGTASGTINPEKDGKVIFETEGRRLMAWEAKDLDGDNVPEVLLTLNPSGSGGFIDFSLLCATGTTYVSTWEDTLKAGQASFADKNSDGKPEIIMSFLEQEDPQKDPASKTAILSFKDGKISVLEGQLHPEPPKE